MHALRRPLCAAALLLAVGCLPEHEPLPPSNSTAPSTLRLGLRLQVETSIAGERVVEIRARYQRASGEQATLPVQPTRVTVRDGATIQQAVVINIGPCNAEAAQQQGDAWPGWRWADRIAHVQSLGAEPNADAGQSHVLRESAAGVASRTDRGGDREQCQRQPR